MLSSDLLSIFFAINNIVMSILMNEACLFCLMSVTASQNWNYWVKEYIALNTFIYLFNNK